MKNKLSERQFLSNRTKKNVPLRHLGRSGPRRNLKLQDVIMFAQDFFDRWKRGIKFEDLRRTFGISKERSQRTMKWAVQEKFLFTLKRTSPQIYYPTSRKAEVIKFVYQNVPNDTTGTNSTGTGKKTVPKGGVFLPFDDLLKRKADSLLEALVLTHTSPRNIHNFHLEYSIPKKYYLDIEGIPQYRSRAKKIEHRIDGNIVKFLYYSNGTATATVACTKNPFGIETIQDESEIHAYLGQVRAKSLDHLSDSKGDIVPKLSQWLLLECDVNIDIEVTDAMQLSFPTIQIYPNVHVMQIHHKLPCKSFFSVLRMYIKSIEDKAILRFEGLMSGHSPVFQTLQNLRYPRELGNANQGSAL
jgi:hypothetical protein